MLLKNKKEQSLRLTLLIESQLLTSASVDRVKFIGSKNDIIKMF